MKTFSIGPAASTEPRRSSMAGVKPSGTSSTWCVTSTIIGVTHVDQLDENIDAWGTGLSPELLAEIDAIRWQHRDPAQ